MKNRHLLPLCWMLCVSLLAAGKAMSAADRQPGKTLQTAVATGTTAIGLQAGDNLLRVVSMKCVESTAGWTAGCPEPVSIPLISFVEAAHRTLPVHWRFMGERKEPGGSETVLLFSCDEPALELRSIWRAYSGPGPIAHTIRIINRGGKELVLPLQPTLAFSLFMPEQPLEQWWVERGGSRPSDFGTHREPMTPGFVSSLVSTPHGGPIPWCSVQDAKGRRGWYAGIEFSGIVRMLLQAGPAGTPQAGTVTRASGWAAAIPRRRRTARACPPERSLRRPRPSSAAMRAAWTMGATPCGGGSRPDFARPPAPTSRS